MNIGIIREDKIPVDKRVPFTPAQCQVIENKYKVKIFVQKSPVRCYSDQEYEQAGISLCEDLSHCDCLFGVKEVPISQLIANKTYFFFSHTIKKQSHNRNLLQSILAKNIRLIDYETLTDTQGKRLVAFGRYAGLVGAYNGIRAYGKRHKSFELKPAHKCFDLEQMLQELQKVRWQASKIALTGTGRVAQGAVEILQQAGVRQVNKIDFLEQDFEYPVFVQLASKDYHQNRTGKAFDSHTFHLCPQEFESAFEDFYKKTDMLIAAAYWHPQAPMLFSKADMKKPDFRIRIIADITCDIEGSIPSTQRPSSIAEPFYDYNPFSEQIEEAFSKPENINVMAVDNLPCELPRNASQDFGKDLIERVLDALLVVDQDQIIRRATITENGKLSPTYSYLQDYVDA